MPAAPDVLSTLVDAGIRYAVWKDLHELEDFTAGDCELDLLVHPADLDALRTHAVEHGYAEFRHHVDIYDGAISHLIRFVQGRHFHLHVHTRLLTGDHIAKEYDLGPLFDAPEQDLFESSVVSAATGLSRVSVVAPEVELAIGAVRLILKSASAGGVKLSELARLRALHAPDRSKAAIERIRSASPLPEQAVACLMDVLAGDDQRLGELAAFAPCFAGLRRLDRGAAFVARWRLRLADALAYRRGLANKVSVRVAPTVAIMGPDGSGKSTLCAEVEATLRKKVSAARIYLGSNSGTYRRLSFIAYLACGALGRLRRALPGLRLLADAHLLAEALLEYAKCRDRVQGIRRGRRLAARGIIVIFERYPLIGLYDYPPLAGAAARGEVDPGPLLARPMRSLLAGIDRLLESEGPADLMLLCRLDFDAIAARRPLRSDEELDIREKLALLESFDFSREPNLQVIPNDGPLEETLADVFDRLGRKLCSRSS